MYTYADGLKISVVVLKERGANGTFHRMIYGDCILPED